MPTSLCRNLCPESFIFSTLLLGPLMDIDTTTDAITKTGAIIKRNRSSQKSPSSGDNGMEDLVNKMARLGDQSQGAKAKSPSKTKSKSASPKDMAGVEEARASASASKLVLDAERASEQFQNAVEELNGQTIQLAEIMTMITNFENTVAGFLGAMKKDHQIGMYAHSVMEQNISSILSSDIRMLRDILKRMSAFPGQLVEQIRAFPEKVKKGIEGVQFYSKSEEFSKLKLPERERYFSYFAQGTFYSPAGLLIKAIGFPTILSKTDSKSKREVLSKIHSFKRMFPTYSFTRLELEFIRRWLNTGKVLFGLNIPNERKLTEEEQKTRYLPLLMALFGKDTFQYFGEEKALSPQSRYEQLIKIRMEELRVIDPSLTKAQLRYRAENEEE